MRSNEARCCIGFGTVSSTDQVALRFGCFLIEHFLQAKEELMLENQKLKDENGALVRVITKLSK